jgi:DNA-3-methyladenine glycosylase
MPAGPPLQAVFYARPAQEVARDLLGRLLVSRIDSETVVARIVETEAYVGPHDPASHAAERIGRTARNAAMFGSPGTAYVYRIYGIHWCLNAVTGPIGFPAAVLIRALEPVAGLAVMERRRSGTRKNGTPLTAIARVVDVAPDTTMARSHGSRPATRPPAASRRFLAGGPGRLAQAMGITGVFDAHPLQEPPLQISSGEPVPDHRVVTGPRIGVTRAVDWPLRFYITDCPFVSR